MNNSIRMPDCKPLQVYYNNFWTGFESESLVSHNVLFQKIFKTNIEHTNNYEEADILCESVFNNTPFLHKKKWKYSFLMSYENYLIYDSEYLNAYTCILSGFIGAKNQISFPYMFERIIDKPIPLTTNDIPSKPVCSVISNPHSQFRNRFLQVLDQHMRVDYGGPYKNNIGYHVHGGHTGNNLIEFYKQYKFVVAMENSKGDYYITEKIYNALKSGKIPVYWGSPNIDTIINPKRILHIRNESDEEIMRVISKMQTMTDAEYISIINEPIFVKPFDTLLNEKIAEIQKFLNLTTLQ